MIIQMFMIITLNFRTGSKRIKHRKTKKVVSQKNREKTQTCINPY